MLDAEQADALGTELEGAFGILRRIRVRADAQLAVLVAHAHELREERVLGGVHRVDGAAVNEALGAVEAQEVTFLEGLVDAGEGDGLVLEVDLEGVAAHDAALAPAAGHEGRVGGHAAALGEDTHGGVHAVDVFRRGLLADEDALLAVDGVLDGVLGGEDDLADGAARGSRETLGQDFGLLLGSRVEDRVEDFVELGRGDAQDGGLLVDQAFIDHVDGHLQGGEAGALADTALQHPQLAFLDGELDVLHVLEVLLEVETDVVQLLVHFRHGGLEGSEVLVLLALGGLVQGVRGADARDHVLALGVDQPFAVELVVTVGRVAGEGHAGGGGVAHVAEHHGLDVHSRAPVVRNVLDLAVTDGALAVPGLEDAADGTPQLGLRIVRELHAQDFLDPHLEGLGEVLQFFGGELGVALVALRVLDVLHHAVQLLADALAVGRLDALGLLHDDVGVHHDEAAVGVIDETGVLGLLDEARDGLGAQADVQDGVHHARHGGTGAGTAAHEKGILRVAELLAHDLLRGLEGGRDLGPQFGRVAATQAVIFRAALGRDGESGGNGHPEEVHFGEVRTLAAEQLAHFAIAFRGLPAEPIDSLFNRFHVRLWFS